jgi:hypothetical protein
MQKKLQIHKRLKRRACVSARLQDGLAFAADQGCTIDFQQRAPYIVKLTRSGKGSGVPTANE